MSSRITGSNPALIRPAQKPAVTEGPRLQVTTQPRSAVNDGFSTRAAPPPVLPPANPAVRGNPLGVVDSAADLEATASKQQSSVLAQARALPSAPAAEQPAKLAQLRRDFEGWRSTVDALVAQGDLGASEVKSFAQLTQQAALVQQNLPANAAALSPADYSKAAQATVAKVAFEPNPSNGEKLIEANPLLNVPSLTESPSIAAAKAAGIPTTFATIDGKNVEVRKDVAVVFCPGVVRTLDDMGAQKQAALDSGFAGVVAGTGTFADPDLNAKAIAAAIDQAKKLTGNPDAKVVLVGYSQGATNVLDLMRDAKGQYAPERNSVLAIHAVHSAAGGSQLADIGFALGDYLTAGGAPKPSDLAQLKPFEAAVAKTLGVPGGQPVIEKGLAGFRDLLGAATRTVEKLNQTAAPVMHQVGLGGLFGQALGKALLGAAKVGRELSQDLAKIGGPVATAAANTLAPVWNAVLSDPSRQLLAQGRIGEVIDGYLQGGLKSLTTQYTDQLLADPALAQHLANVPVLNSPGAVPQAREDELLPPSQRLFYQTFRELGLESDAEVALQNQQKLGQLPTAVNLAPDASGHWGEQGLVVADGTPNNYAAFSPGGWMTSLLAEDHALGLL